LRQRATAWQQALAGQGLVASAQASESAIGGGSLPGETLPTQVLALAHPQPDAAAARLRTGATPVICRIQRDQLYFDPRTVLPEQDELLIRMISAGLERRT
jgi:L-seryl-tRNA(Ser) seleniumtransferase